MRVKHTDVHKVEHCAVQPRTGHETSPSRKCGKCEPVNISCSRCMHQSKHWVMVDRSSIHGPLTCRFGDCPCPVGGFFLPEERQGTRLTCNQPQIVKSQGFPAERTYPRSYRTTCDLQATCSPQGFVTSSASFGSRVSLRCAEVQDTRCHRRGKELDGIFF